MLHLKSRQDTAEERCPYCGGLVHICGSCSMRLRDMPLYSGTRQDMEITYHRYRCRSCARSFCEEIPFKCPEARITERAASWISAFLRLSIPISTVQRITGVHWDTIKRIQKEIMDEAIADRRRKLLREGYKPKPTQVMCCGWGKEGRRPTSPSSSRRWTWITSQKSKPWLWI